MAKTLKHEELRTTYILDGNEAQAELIKLENNTNKLKKANVELKELKKRMELEGKKETEAYKKLSLEIRENSKVIKNNGIRMKELREKIGITGLSLAQLRKEANFLKLALANVVPGSDPFNQYKARLKEVNDRMRTLRTESEQTKLSIGKIADGFNRYAALAASVVASLTGVVISIQKVLDYNSKLSDAQSDVMKTTGLTKKEVDELSKSFGAMKTRTARIELLGLAEEAGRLGIEGKENIEGFVRVANQLKIALGDDLNDTQIRDVGKLVETYRVGEETGRDFEGAMLSLGSAINEVSASGSNQASYLVDFLKRTTGISGQIKLSAAANIGYAATFDELGQNVEVTSTMMNKIWADMASNTETYARISGMSVADFSKLFKEDANQAMLTFLKSLKGNSAGFQEMITLLGDVEAGGTRGDAALAALVEGIDKLEERQKTANIAMSEAVSLTEEAALKDRNLAALLDKIKKTITGWYSSDTFVQWLTDAVEWFAKFIGATEDTDGSVTKFRNTLVTIAKVIAIVTAAMVTHTAWQKLVQLWTTKVNSAKILETLLTKKQIVAENLAKISKAALATVTALFTGNLKQAATAFRALTLAMSTTPWGAILTVIAAVTTAIVLFSEETKEASETAKKLAEVENEVAVAVKKEENELQRLLRIARDETKSKAEREAAIKKINQISPEYLGNISLEKINTQETTRAIEGYIKALKHKLKVQALERKIEESYNKEIELRDSDINEDHGSWKDYFILGKSNKQIRQERKDWAIWENNNKRERLERELQKELEKDSTPITSSDTTPDSAGSSSGKPKGTKGTGGKSNHGKSNHDKELEELKNAHKERLREIEKYFDEKIKLEREWQDGNVDLLKDGFEKENLAETYAYERKIEDLRKRLIDETEIEKAMQESKNTKLSEEQRKSYLDLANAWKENNKAIYRNIEQETALHYTRKTILIEKYTKTEADKLKESYDRESVLRETRQNNELAALGENQRERKKLEDKHREENYKAEEKHLQDLLDLYQKMLQGNKIEGIDFSLLTEEQKKKLIEEIENIELLMSRLKNAMPNAEQNGMLGNGEESIGLNKPDVLGFTQEQWNTFFENIKNGTVGLETLGMGVQILGGIWNQYASMVEANEARMMQNYEKNINKKQERLKRQLDTGLVSQEQYNRASKLLEEDLARKKAELEYKQAKRKKAMDIVNAISSTALAVLNALNSKPFLPTGLAMASIAGAMGALQVAQISRQPLPAPGFEFGLYPSEIIKREQDGKLFRSTFGGETRSGIVSKPTHFLAGENGPEMIIDSKAYKQISPDVKNSLIRELKIIKGYEKGLYPTLQETESSTDTIPITALISALERNSEVLNKLEKNGVLAVLSSDFRTAKKLKDLQSNYESFIKSKQIS